MTLGRRWLGIFDCNRAAQPFLAEELSVLKTLAEQNCHRSTQCQLFAGRKTD